MAFTVVLVRHGEAKSKKLGQTDFERELTKRGAQALEKAFPQVFNRLKPTDKSELWVSTAVRARQTAQIANKTLGIKTVRELDFLYDQDDRKFMNELAQSQGQADLIVVVGHIPFMEDACFLLTQAYQPFSTGAVAAVQLDDNLLGELLWLEQGPSA